MQEHTHSINHTLQTLESLNKEVFENTKSLNKKIKSALKLTNDEDCKKVMLEVLKFLFLISKSNKILTPSIHVDNAWHEFILHTRSYEKFCQKNFAKFIHHTPGGDEKENQQRFKQTLALYTLNYGKPVQPWWPETPFNMDTCGSCLTSE